MVGDEGTKGKLFGVTGERRRFAKILFCCRVVGFFCQPVFQGEYQAGALSLVCVQALPDGSTKGLRGSIQSGRWIMESTEILKSI
jgi:hypothetical protein